MPEPLRGDRHGWNSLDHYIAIHDACLNRFDYFIEENTISFVMAGSESIEVKGRLLCTGGVYLNV